MVFWGFLYLHYTGSRNLDTLLFLLQRVAQRTRLPHLARTKVLRRNLEVYDVVASLTLAAFRNRDSVDKAVYHSHNHQRHYTFRCIQIGVMRKNVMTPLL